MICPLALNKYVKPYVLFPSFLVKKSFRLHRLPEQTGSPESVPKEILASKVTISSDFPDLKRVPQALLPKPPKSRGESTVPLLVGLTVLLAAAFVFTVNALDKKKIRSAVTKRVTDIVKNLTVSSDLQSALSEHIDRILSAQKSAIQTALISNVLKDGDFTNAAFDWAKEQAIAVCKDEEVVAAMAGLLQEATQRPELRENIIALFKEVSQSREMAEMSKNFISKTLKDEHLIEEVCQAGKGTLETIVRDPQLQSTLSNSLWAIARRAALPRWFLGGENIKISRRPATIPTKASLHTKPSE